MAIRPCYLQDEFAVSAICSDKLKHATLTKIEAIPRDIFDKIVGYLSGEYLGELSLCSKAMYDHSICETLRNLAKKQDKINHSMISGFSYPRPHLFREHIQFSSQSVLPIYEEDASVSRSLTQWDNLKSNERVLNVSTQEHVSDIYNCLKSNDGCDWMERKLGVHAHQCLAHPMFIEDFSYVLSRCSWIQGISIEVYDKLILGIDLDETIDEINVKVIIKKSNGQPPLNINFSYQYVVNDTTENRHKSQLYK